MATTETTVTADITAAMVSALTTVSALTRVPAVMTVREQRPNKQPALGGSDAVIVVLGLCALAAGLAGVGLVVWGAAWLAGTGSSSPRAWVLAPAGPRWNTGATVVLVSAAVVLAAAAAPVVTATWRRRRRRVWTDGLARVMSTRRDFADLTEAAVRRDTNRLGASHVGTGTPLGRAVVDGTRLYSTYEWSQLWVMGMRAGKTRAVAVPQILSHHGPVVATSNKDDLHDYTAGPRSELGRVWVNDPQDVVSPVSPPAPSSSAASPASSAASTASGVAGSASVLSVAGWWWNPLTFVTTVERAERLVAIWAASRTSEDTTGVDPYFEPEGRSLAATLLMAAARGGQYVTRLPDWLTGEPPEPGVPDPTEILRATGLTQMAKDVERLLRLDKGQRDGVYGTAASFFRWLRDPRYVQWVTPTPATSGTSGTSGTSSDVGTLGRAEFDPAAFVASAADTLYLLSKEGPGSARAITGALVAAVYTAGEDLARAQGGRVTTPVLFMLDEVANVCRWPELPNIYSHAGGRGLIMVSILQAPSQGVRIWGELGFKDMWSFTNILGAGRGQNDVTALSDLSRLVGDRQIRDASTSTSTGSTGHRTTSTSIRSERILEESDLRALPMGRAILLASGVRPVLLQTVDFTDHPQGWKATASRAHYISERSEAAARTLTARTQTAGQNENREGQASNDGPVVRPGIGPAAGPAQDEVASW